MNLEPRIPHPVDTSRVEMGDTSDMDLTGIFAAIEAGRFADSPEVPQP